MLYRSGKVFLVWKIQFKLQNHFTMSKKYSDKASEKVHEALHEMKEGKLKSGQSDKKVTSRKQAIAIGLSEAREEGDKVPKKKE